KLPHRTGSTASSPRSANRTTPSTQAGSSGATPGEMETSGTGMTEEEDLQDPNNIPLMNFFDGWDLTTDPQTILFAAADAARQSGLEKDPWALLNEQGETWDSGDPNR